MTTIETTVQNRRVEVSAPSDIPDGTRVTVEVTPVLAEKVGITESEWRDDPEALADWRAWIKTIEPIEWVTNDEFDHEFRLFNIETVRKQMEEGSGP